VSDIVSSFNLYGDSEFVFPVIYYYNYQMKVDDMDRACSTHGTELPQNFGGNI
jgi:hypothetical protein